MTIGTENPYPYAPWPSYESEGWIFDEDRALRDLMKGMKVSDYESGGQVRNVEAWFGHPDQELREQKYPYVTIDLLQIQEGRERVHRGDYFFTEPPAWWGLEPLTGRELLYLMEMPTPVDLDYQVATWARNPRHDRQILQQMITGNRSMLRAGLLWTADGTNRRLDVLSHIKRDTVENSKRLFNNVFRVRISSQVPWGVLGANYSRLSQPAHIRVSFWDREGNDIRIRDDAIARGTVAAPPRSGGNGKKKKKKPKDGPSTGAIWDSRFVDVDVDGYTATARIAKTVPDLLVGDEVVLALDPTVETPTGPADYEYTVISKSPY